MEAEIEASGYVPKTKDIGEKLDLPDVVV